MGNMIRVKHEELKDLVKKYYRTAKKRSVWIWGTIGIGKSDMVEDTARELAKEEKLEFIKDVMDEDKFVLMDVRLSQIDGTDLKGIPFKSKDGNATKWLLPDWLPRNPKSKGILFFDEMNLATDDVQSSAYSLMYDHKIGSYRLPKGWLCVSAGNRIVDVQNVFETSKALENRFGHCELEVPSNEEWKDWALDHDVDKRVIAYVMWQGERLMTYRPEMEDRNDLNEKAFATPRTWEFTSDLIKDETDFDRIERLTSTCVGQGNAVEFVAFLKLRVNVDFKKYIRNPELVSELSDREDLLYTFTLVLSDWYRSNYQQKHLKRILEICEHLQPEFSILTLRMCKRHHEKKFKDTLKALPQWKNNLSKKYSMVV